MFSKLIQQAIHRQQEQESQENKIFTILRNFYDSFFTDTYNELNIGRYKQIRDAIGLVLHKFAVKDHPVEYAAKLTLYLPARVTLHHLHLSREQQGWLRELTELTKSVNLNYVYLGRLDSFDQFK
ncbi:MAG: bacteriocin immunity protein [Limosilactobacillus sp.]|uniref:bacteriocin immunity protein n=1 Tax=Limosilactobacillus sp. TaxID=2773925 RepID=UPI003F067B09